MKDYRNKEMKTLMVIFFFLCVLLCTPIREMTNIKSEEPPYFKLLAVIESSVISGMLSMAAFLSDSLISNKMKDALVGLFIIPKSGESIFSKIKTDAIRDDRFQNSDAVEKYSDIISGMPQDKKKRRKYENTRWYKIYYVQQGNPQVFQEQTDYLMCRDLYVETIMFYVFYIVAVIFFPKVFSFSWKFSALLAIVAVLLCICTHNKMRRFVYTVIAIDLAKKTGADNSGEEK